MEAASGEMFSARAQFEFMLESAITNQQLAYEAAKGLSFFKAQARDIARQRRMNQMVENQIIAMEEMFNVIVACQRSEEVNHVPFPPIINRSRTLLNFTNHVGQPDYHKAEIPIK